MAESAYRMTAERVEIRCPSCKRLQFVVVERGFAVIEVKCRCDATLEIRMAHRKPLTTKVISTTIRK